MRTGYKNLGKYFVFLGCCIAVSACSTVQEASLIGKSEVTQLRREYPPSRVVMKFDHQEKYERAVYACYYLTPENLIGETIGVMIYADGCPKSIIYDFSLIQWEPYNQQIRS